MASNAPPEAPPQEDLPINAWVLGRTATSENGKAAPEVRLVEGKKEPGKIFYILNYGILAAGGDSKLDPRAHHRKMCYGSIFIQPGDKEIVSNKTGISGNLTAFLNAVFACGVGDDLLPVKGDSSEIKKEKAAKRNNVRWTATIEALKAVAATNPTLAGEAVTLDGYGGDRARYLANLACITLGDTSRALLFKTKKDTYKGVDKTIVGQVEDATTANATKRKVERFPTDGETAEAPTKEPLTF